MKNSICIYHGNCPDGFGAAYALWRKHRSEFDFYPGIYQQDPPWEYLEDKHLYLLDFSYKKDIMEKLIYHTRSVTIIDHHKSAIEDLESLDGLNKYFDINHSGCILTWKHVYPLLPIPEVLKYIEDRDLWKFELPNSKAVSMALMSYDYDFEVWDKLISYPIRDLINDGKAILKKFNKDLHELIAINKRRINICGYDVPIINLPYIYASDAGEILCENEAFSASYYYKQSSINVSLRSNKFTGIDVSEIASRFGGGGHKNAAGFELNLADDNLKFFSNFG